MIILYNYRQSANIGLKDRFLLCELLVCMNLNVLITFPQLHPPMIQINSSTKFDFYSKKRLQNTGLHQRTQIPINFIDLFHFITLKASTLEQLNV